MCTRSSRRVFSSSTVTASSSGVAGACGTALGSLSMVITAASSSDSSLSGTAAKMSSCESRKASSPVTTCAMRSGCLRRTPTHTSSQAAISLRPGMPMMPYTHAPGADTSSSRLLSTAASNSTSTAPVARRSAEAPATR